MAIAGSWNERYADAQAYTGATRWGTGYNPIHELRDNPGRVTGIRGNLYPLGTPSDAPPETILNADDFVGADWDGEDPYPDEVFRYQDTEPHAYRGVPRRDRIGRDGRVDRVGCLQRREPG